MLTRSHALQTPAVVSFFLRQVLLPKPAAICKAAPGDLATGPAAKEHTIATSHPRQTWLISKPHPRDTLLLQIISKLEPCSLLNRNLLMSNTMYFIAWGPGLDRSRQTGFSI